MPSLLRTIRAFSVELMKEASKIMDADIRKLLAERKGEEYLEGGRLPTNTEAEIPFQTKVASNGSYTAPRNMATTSGAIDVLDSHKKKHNRYQKVRDYTGTAMRGGLTGLGVLGATNAMRGRFGSPSNAHAVRAAAKSVRRAAGAGAAIAVADKAYRYDDVPTMDKKAFVVSPNPSAAFKSPSLALSETRETGGFKPSVIHDSGKATKSIQLGRKFNLP